MRPEEFSKPCRVAFVGAGFMTREHARAFAAVPGVQLVGIFSRSRARAEAVAAEFGIAQTCDSLEALYRQCAPDLLVVSVPELEMREVARASFAFPWTVLLEKPAGYDMSDATAILGAAGEAADRVFVALNRRWYSATLAALADLAGNGGHRYIRVQDQQDQQVALDLGQPPEVVKNWMYANSIHVIDYLTLFGRGAVRSVEPVIRWDPREPAVVVAKVSFDSGDVGIYEGIWKGPGPWAVTVSTPTKRWEMRPLEQAAYQDAGSRRLVPIEPDAHDTSFKAGIYMQAREAVRAAAGLEHRLPSIGEAMRSMRLVEAIFS